jgi:hypothetical protein
MFQSAHEPPPPTCSLPARRRQITKIRLRDRIQSYARTRRPALRLAVQNDGTPAAPSQVSGQVSSDPCCAMIAYASSSLTLPPPRHLGAQINKGPQIKSTDCYMLEQVHNPDNKNELYAQTALSLSQFCLLLAALLCLREHHHARAGDARAEVSYPEHLLLKWWPARSRLTALLNAPIV